MNAIPLILNLTIFGFFITYFFRLKLFFEERVWVGLLIGFVALGYYSLFAMYFSGLNSLSLISFLVFTNLVSVYILLNENFIMFKHDLINFKQRIKQKSWISFISILLVFVLMFCFLASQLLIRKNDSFIVQPVHAYGDISLHLGIISSFAYGINPTAQNPIFSNSPISYPFMFDFITAVFINAASLQIEESIAITGVLMTAIVILSLGYFGLVLTRKKLAGILFLLIFIFNGGFGFLVFFQDLITNQNPLDFLMHLQKDYTALKDIGYQWINVVISMFLPQRGFLLGLSLGLLILRIFWHLTEEFNKRSFILGVLLYSLLPIIHAHTMIALSPFLIWFSLKFMDKNRSQIKYIIPIGLCGMMVIYILSKIFLGQSENPFGNIKFQLGWMAHGEDLLIFYLKNFGLSIIVLPFLIFLAILQRLKIAYFAMIGLFWFILPSFFIFQPWDFDNTKLFIYWYLTASLLIAYFLSKLFERGRVINLVIGVGCIFVLTFSGGLDIYRLLISSGTKNEAYSPAAIKMSEFVKENTEKDAIFLAVDKFDNPAVTLAGRKAVLGFHGWLWTYGLDFSEREKDVRLMLAGKADKEMFEKYNISNVIFFAEPFNYEIDKNYFYTNFKLIYNTDGYEIFKI